VGGAAVCGEVEGDALQPAAMQMTRQAREMWRDMVDPSVEANMCPGIRPGRQSKLIIGTERRNSQRKKNR
jgi:hypothetical protein